MEAEDLAGASGIEMETEHAPEVEVVSAADQWSAIFADAKVSAKATAMAKARAKRDRELQPSKDWTLEDFRRNETRVQKKRDNTDLSQVGVSEPSGGKDGPLHHKRLGLVALFGQDLAHPRYTGKLRNTEQTILAFLEHGDIAFCTGATLP